ncbi:MAG: ribosome maturation factor RimM [Mycobacteriales bacterium]
MTVGRIGRAHGIRGDVSIDVRTDEPERRFAPGSSVHLSFPRSDGATAARMLTVRTARPQGARLVVAFTEVADRTAAEALRGAVLEIDVDPDERPADDEEFYDHQLVGLQLRGRSGAEVGTVTEVLHLPGQDTLAVCTVDGGDLLVPFVSALVPTVDVAGGYVVVADVPGLLDTVAGERAAGS